MAVRGYATNSTHDIIMVKKQPNCGTPLDGEWHLPGGKLEPGEDWIAGMIREYKEETGLDTQVVEILGTTEPNCSIGETLWLTVYFRLEVVGDWSGFGSGIPNPEIEYIQMMNWAQAQTYMGPTALGWLPKDFWNKVYVPRNSDMVCITAPGKKDQCDCGCTHIMGFNDAGACQEFTLAMNGRCLVCDHAEKCHA